jgi:hypothetical protein
MTCGATGWLFSPTRALGWRPGVRGRASRTVGCPLPCCRKAKGGARTPICYGVQPCGSAPMTTLSAGPRTNRDPDAGMTPNNPDLPAQGRGGANQPHPRSNPVAARIERLRTCLTAPCPSHYSQPSGLCQVDAEAIAAARFRRLAKPFALVPRRLRRAIDGHSSLSPQSSWCEKCLRRSAAFSLVLSG